jgi:hypothetical protein
MLAAPNEPRKGEGIEELIINDETRLGGRDVVD